MRAYMPLTMLCLFLAPQVLGGQAAPSPSQTPPTFRSQVQYIEVDVRVTDERGRIVQGLDRDDFTIVEGGRAQAISTFSYVDVPIEPAQVRAAVVTAPESDI
jgi:hypothetical protein